MSMYYLQKTLELIQAQFNGISVEILICTMIMGLLLVHFIYSLWIKIKMSKYDLMTEIWLGVLVCYICFIFQITYFNREEYSRIGIYATLTDIVIRQSINQVICNCLNIVLFVPIGVVLAYLLKSKKKMQQVLFVLLFCSFGSFLIENAQLISGRGFFELIDIITNVLGGLIGLEIVRFTRRIYHHYLLKQNGKRIEDYNV